MQCQPSLKTSWYGHRLFQKVNLSLACWKGNCFTKSGEWQMAVSSAVQGNSGCPQEWHICTLSCTPVWLKSQHRWWQNPQLDKTQRHKSPHYVALPGVSAIRAELPCFPYEYNNIQQLKLYWSSNALSKELQCTRITQNHWQYVFYRCPTAILAHHLNSRNYHTHRQQKRYVFLVRFIKTHRDRRGTAPLILILGTRWRWV